MAEQLERIRSFVGRDGNLVMWAQLFINQPSGTVRGWLLDSWSEHGEPYWLPKLHWFDKSDQKFYHVYMGDGFGGSSSLHRRSEDADIDPKRAGFVRKMLEKWELEWLQDEGKKL